ncbi:MAG: S8 family serine peptidase [Candidatus Nanohaloarchaea archaeon]
MKKTLLLAVVLLISMAAAPGLKDDPQSAGYKVVRLENTPDASRKETLEKQGIHLLKYIGNGRWYARIEARDQKRTQGLQRLIASARGIAIQEKLGKNLQQSGPPARAVHGNTATFRMDFFSGVSIREQKRVLRANTADFRENGDAWRVKLKRPFAVRAERLAGIPEVKYIRNVPPRKDTFNDQSRATINVDVLQQPPLNLEGANYTAAEFDGGWAGKHADLNYTGKLVRGDTGGACGSCAVAKHATHVAGTMLGNGTLKPKYRGMAPAARLATYEWPDTESELRDDTDEAVGSYNAILSQNSWGWKVTSSNRENTMGDYGGWSQAYDAIIANQTSIEPVPIVFAAGNEGDNWATPFNTTTGPGGTAKNTITVGSWSPTLGRVSSFSSRGPTDDGRIKPDIVADGRWVNSTVPGNSYEAIGGTSMAAPAISGLLILLTQRFEQVHGRQPAPATLKSVLIHTATDKNLTGPDYHTGWGLADGEEAAAYINWTGNRTLLRRGSVSDGEEDSYFYTGKGPARITLTWSDYPASTSANKTLANDLDLVVTDSSGTRYYPWSLNWSLRKQGAVRTREDHRNNVEQVYLTASGNFNVTVQGYSVPQPPQSYSLTVSKNFEALPPQVSITHPVNRTYSRESLYLNVTTNRTVSRAFYSLDSGPNKTLYNDTGSEFYRQLNLSEGSHRVTVYAESPAGKTNSSSIRFTVDTAPPRITIESPLNQSYNTSSIYFNASLSEPATSVNYSVDGNVNTSVQNDSRTHYYASESIADGQHRVVFYSVDSHGNTDSASRYFNVDTEPPELYIESPRNTSYPTGDINFSVSSPDRLTSVNFSVGGPNSTTKLVNGSYVNTSYSVLSDGSYTVDFWGIDTAGNLNHNSTSFTVDTAPPSLDLVTPVNTTYASQNITVNVTSDEELENINATVNSGTLKLVLRNGYYINSSFTASKGTSTLRVTAADPAGNNASTATSFTVDTSPPAINMKKPRNITYRNGTAIPLNFTVDDPANITYSLGDTNISVPGNTTLNLSEGRYKLRLYANNSAGLLASEKVRFAVDETAPNVTVLEPSGNYSRSDLSINVSSKDGFSVSSVKLGVGGLNYTLNSSSGNYWIGNATMPDGDYNITAYSTDRAGNTATDDQEMLVDTEKPEFNASVSSRLAKINTTVELKAEAEDPRLDSVTANITLPGGNWTSVRLRNRSGSWKYSLNSTGETGTYRVVFRANDTLGNNVTETEFFDITEPARFNATFSSPAVNWSITYGSDVILQNRSTEIDAEIPSGQLSLELEQNNDSIVFSSINFTGNVSTEIFWDSTLPDSVGGSGYDTGNGVAAKPGLNFSSATIKLNYTGSPDTVLKCSSWNFSTSSCSTSWESVAASFGNGKAEIRVDSMSAYIVAEEIETSDSADTGGGGGGGGGGFSLETSEEKEMKTSREKIWIENAEIHGSKSFDIHNHSLVDMINLSGDTDHANFSLRKFETSRPGFTNVTGLNITSEGVKAYISLQFEDLSVFNAERKIAATPENPLVKTRGGVYFTGREQSCRTRKYLTADGCVKTDRCNVPGNWSQVRSCSRNETEGENATVEKDRTLQNPSQPEKALETVKKYLPLIALLFFTAAASVLWIRVRNARKEKLADLAAGLTAEMKNGEVEPEAEEKIQEGLKAVSDGNYRDALRILRDAEDRLKK